MRPTITHITIEHRRDENPDMSHLGKLSNVKQGSFDIDLYLRNLRFRLFLNDEWHMLLIRAVAHIKVNGINQTLHSAGIGGVESDASPEFLSELNCGQLDELRAILKDFGFKVKEIKAAFATSPTDITTY